MFDQILDLVKDQLKNNPEVAQAVPAGREEELHREVAAQLNNGIKQQASAQGGIGDLLSGLTEKLQGGSPITSAITGGLVGSLGSKFGLSPAVTGAIAAALPGLLQKFAHKVNDPNDNSITPESMKSSIFGDKGLGGLF